MIVAADMSRLPPSDKAAILYDQAHGDLAARLWRAALGSEDTGDTAASGTSSCPDMDLDSLLSLIMPKSASVPVPAPPTGFPAAIRSAAAAEDPGTDAVQAEVLQEGAIDGLGPNARYASAIEAAATRTGLPAAALAAIVDAEAGKACDGSWKTGSRNPRSSAAGLGQFLGSTWQSEAERSGTWLHDVAAGQGWLGEDGRVLPAARSALLALRYDGSASIQATADYALRSIATLKKAGIAIGPDVSTVARAAYLGHHLGTGDAVRFLKGGLQSGRAERLLHAQVGAASAGQRIARSGDAASAHRAWLLEYIDRHVTPTRFAADPQVQIARADMPGRARPETT